MRFPALHQWKADGNSVKLESSMACLYIYISWVHKPSLPFDFKELTHHDGHLFFYGWGVTMPDIAFLRWQIGEWSLFVCIWIWPLESAGGNISNGSDACFSRKYIIFTLFFSFSFLDDHGNSNGSHVKIFLPKKLLECLPKCSSLPKERHRWNTNEVARSKLFCDNRCLVCWKS